MRWGQGLTLEKLVWRSWKDGNYLSLKKGFKCQYLHLLSKKLLNTQKNSLIYLVNMQTCNDPSMWNIKWFFTTLSGFVFYQRLRANMHVYCFLIIKIFDCILQCSLLFLSKDDKVKKNLTSVEQRALLSWSAFMISRFFNVKAPSFCCVFPPTASSRTKSANLVCTNLVWRNGETASN